MTESIFDRTHRGGKLLNGIVKTLNDICQEEGGIEVNNPKIWDEWLHQMDIELWEDHCILVWPVNREQANKWFAKKFPEVEADDFKMLDSCQAISVLGDTYRIVFFREWKNNEEYFGHLTHECVHISNHILLDKGVRRKGC